MSFKISILDSNIHHKAYMWLLKLYGPPYHLSDSNSVWEYTMDGVFVFFNEDEYFHFILSFGSINE